MSELWTVTLMFRGSARQVNLAFSGEAAAKKCFESFVPSIGCSAAQDHWGTEVLLPEHGSLEAVVLQDVAKCMEADVERALHQARAQAKANRAAAGDAQLKFLGGGMPMPPGFGTLRG